MSIFTQRVDYSHSSGLNWATKTANNVGNFFLRPVHYLFHGKVGSYYCEVPIFSPITENQTRYFSFFLINNPLKRRWIETAVLVITFVIIALPLLIMGILVKGIAWLCSEQLRTYERKFDETTKLSAEDRILQKIQLGVHKGSNDIIKNALSQIEQELLDEYVINYAEIDPLKRAAYQRQGDRTVLCHLEFSKIDDRVAFKITAVPAQEIPSKRLPEDEDALLRKAYFETAYQPRYEG